MRVYTLGDRDQVKINNLHLTEWEDSDGVTNSANQIENNVTVHVVSLFIHILMF